MPTTPDYFIGLDLGQRQDFTALAVLERAEVVSSAYDWVRLATRETARERRLNLVALERVKLGTPYPEIVGRVREVARSAALAGRCMLVADGTGLGGPVLEMLRAADLGCRVAGVTITGGSAASRVQGGWHVPKRDLVLGLRVALEMRELRIAGGLGETDRLVEELANMRSRVEGPGRESFGAARQGVHDDLAMAVALAVWAARRGRVGEVGERLNY